ncbi:Small nuclear ribonucleoprotein family protein [Striga hermonthica]|uniref:Small nuclear ribonucleoprotein E n=8 Tax=lamiids TaxID=91888 RepID=A0A9N7NWB2_STRHE|nr:Small nuclear ribonucleoprotein family protein [Striga hermonthica]
MGFCSREVACDLDIDVLSEYNVASRKRFSLFERDIHSFGLALLKSLIVNLIQQAAAMASTKVQRIMTQPINLIFRFLQSKARIQIWLFEQKDLRIEGRIIGFDEYMNLVLDDAEEVNVKKNSRKQLGRILLKGDNITLMMNTGK